MSPTALWVDFITLECGHCGIHFQVTEAFNRECRENGKSWYCPNGHSRVYRESDVKRLERELAQERARHDQTQAALQTKERQLARIHRGVCPHCKRSFQNLARHMKCKHPKATP